MLTHNLERWDMKVKVFISSLVALFVFACTPSSPEPPKHFPASPYFFLNGGCIWGLQRHYFLKITEPGAYSIQYFDEFGNVVPTNVYLYWALDDLPADLHLVTENRPVQILWSEGDTSPYQIASQIQVTPPKNPCDFK